MPFIQPTTKYPRPDLANVGFIQNYRLQANIGHLIAPPVPTALKYDNYDKLSAKTLNQLPTTQGSQGGRAGRVEVQMTVGTFECKQNWIEQHILDSKRAERPNVDWDAFAAGIVGGIIGARHEKRVQALVQNNTNFPASGSTGANISTAWNTAGATPAADVAPGILILRQNTGCPLEWLTLVISESRYLTMASVTDVYNKLKIQTQPFGTLLPLELLAAYFNVGRVVVGRAVYDANDGGVATASMTAMWTSTEAFLCVTPPRNLSARDVMLPQVARTFVWDNAELSAAAQIQALTNPDSGIDAVPIMIDMYRDDTTKADVIRADQWTTEEIVNSTAGYRLTGV